MATLSDDSVCGFSLSLTPGKIAVPADGEACSHVLKNEPDAALAGRVFFLNGWGVTRGRDSRTALRGVRFAALRASDLEDLPELGDELWTRHERKVAETWQQQLDQIRQTDKFDDLVIGSAQVELFRSGECRIHIDPDDHSITRWVRSSGDEAFWGKDLFEELERETLRECAEEVFKVVRNLAHKHYHHKGQEPPSWALTEWQQAEDRVWRNATMHSLLRSAIALRRKDTADGYRRALGVLAYADSFQRHMATWSNERGEAVKIKNRMAYDLAALRASIESSLKVRELSDQGTRGRMIFAFGTLVTALTLIAPTLREYLPDVSPNAEAVGTQTWFVRPLTWMVANPVPALVTAAASGALLDWIMTRWAFNKDFSNTAARASQLLDMTLAWVSDRLHLGSRLTQMLVIALLVAGLWTTAVMWLEVAHQSGILLNWRDFLPG